jgi:hypothetical protein
MVLLSSITMTFTPARLFAFSTVAPLVFFLVNHAI